MLFQTAVRGITTLHTHVLVLTADTGVVILELAAHTADTADMVALMEVWALIRDLAAIIQAAMAVTEDTELG